MIGVQAQTDVTSMYLTNADFSSGWSATDIGSSTVNDVTGWSHASSGDTWYYGGAISYAGGVKVNSVTVSSNPDGGTTGGALGLSIGWGCTVRYTQAVTFPAGKYRISYKAYNANPDARQVYNYIGFVESNNTEHYGSINNFIPSTWMEDEIIVNLTSATSGNISIGIGAVSGGSGANAKLFIDYIKIEAYNPAVSNMVGDEVTPGSWTGNTGTYQSTYPEYFGEHFTGDAMTSETTVDNGTYDVDIYFQSHMAWKDKVAEDGSLNSYIDAEGTKKYVGIVNNVGFAAYEPKLYHLSDINVSDGKLNLAVGNSAQGGNWLTVKTDKIVKKTGATVNYGAANFPIGTSGTTVTQDYWYVYNVVAAGEHTITSSEDATIYYTQDGTQAANGGTYSSVVLSAGVASGKIDLSSGALYVKSNAATTITVTPASYTYTVGSATSNITYIQKDNTVTISYADLGTDDPDATLVKNFSGVTFGGNTISVTPTANGFTFTVPTVTAGTDYTLYIPAYSIGYSNGGGTYNEAQNITLHTPAVFDGTYYLYHPTTSRFLARGQSYGTAAVADFYGVPFTLTVDNDGYVKMVFIDNEAGLFNGGGEDIWCWTDNTAASYQFTIVEGGYNIKGKDVAGDNYLYVSTVDNYRVGYKGAATVWQLKTPAERNAIVNAYPTDNKNNVITDASISTTAAEFETWLADNRAAKDMTSFVGTAKFTNAVGDWTWTGVRAQGGQPAYNNAAEAWVATGSWSQTITELPQGIYKVTVNGFERRANNATSYALGQAGYGTVTSSYLKANDEQVRLKSWYEEVVKDGDNYDPNSMSQAVTAFNNDKYKSEVYTYVGSDGNLTLTVAKPNYIWDCWLLWNNITLTYYDSEVSEEDAQAIIADATTAMNSAMKPSLYQALASAKATFEASTTVPNYNALRTAIDNCATSIASYASMNANYLERIESLLASTNVYKTTTEEYVKYTDYKSRYENYKTDDSEKDIENATANALNAYAGDKGTRPVDLVLMPSWTIGGVATGNKFYQNTWSDEGAGDGTNFLLPFYEYWVSGEKVLDATTLQATQTGLTAKGIYKVSAWVRVQESTAGAKIDNGITMQVGEGPSVDVSAGEKIGETNRYIGEYTAYGQADNDGNLVIKFVVAEGSNISWLAFKNVNYEEVPATVSVTLDGTTGYATFGSQYPLNLTPENLATGVKAYKATSVDNETIQFVALEQGVPANTGILIAGEPGQEVTIPVATSTSEVEGNLLHVNDKGTTFDAESGYSYYGLKKGTKEFRPFNPESVAIPANKAYLKVENINSSRLVIRFDGEDPTAINAIEAAEANDGVLKDGKYLVGNKVVLVKNGVKYGANGQKLN